MRSRWMALCALCLAELLVMVDNTIVNVALPTMSRDLGAGISGLQWIVDAYTLVFAGLLLTGGYLGDRFGHRRMLLVGLAGFAGVSALAASSNTLGQLIAARAGLGVFAALVFPATLALIVAIFPEGKQRATGSVSGVRHRGSPWRSDQSSEGGCSSTTRGRRCSGSACPSRR